MSPAKNQTDPEARPARLLAYFTKNPGHHRAKDVAAALGEPTQYVANECGRMVRKGVLLRVRTTVPGRATPVVEYRLPVPKTRRKKAAK